MTPAGSQQGPLSASNLRAPRGDTLRLPDFFIVGQPKSGTTALYEMLRRHPQIFMPENKEPWFFADELLERTPPRPGGTPATLEEYAGLFEEAPAGMLLGEASALYLWSQTSARRIAAAVPDARIVAILREPAALLRSLHLQFLRTYVEVETDFASAIALEAERREGRCVPPHTYWPQALMYSEHVRYVEQLRRFREAFSSERMLVLIYDDFRRDNDKAVREVLRFLEVDDGVSIEIVDANLTVGVRSRRVHEAVNAVSVGCHPLARAVKTTVRAVVPAAFRREMRHRLLFSAPPAPDQALLVELRRRFRPEVVALSDFLDRDLLSLWGYDGVG